MGILGSQSKFYESNIKEHLKSTAELGYYLDRINQDAGL
jgi:hypothetical protein